MRRGKRLKSTRYYTIKHEVFDLLIRWNRVAATHDGWRDESISPTNDTNRHKSILEPSAIFKVLHKSCRWLCATGWRGDITITVNGELMPCKG